MGTRGPSLWAHEHFHRCIYRHLLCGVRLSHQHVDEPKPSATASEPDENAMTVEDWAATIYNRIGIVSDKELMAPGDRPIEIVDGGEVRQELIV